MAEAIASAAALKGMKARVEMEKRRKAQGPMQFMTEVRDSDKE